MALNTDDSFILLNKIRHDFSTNLISGEDYWAGVTPPYFTVPSELYTPGATGSIIWDTLGLADASQAEYDAFAAILYGIEDVYPAQGSSSSSGSGPVRNFIDNLAIFNGWIMVNIYPPANLRDVYPRDDLPISYNKLAVFALQHLRDRMDSELDLRYDYNVFYSASLSATETQLNITPPLFPVVVENGLDYLVEIPAYRAARAYQAGYPECSGEDDPYDDTSLLYCNYRTPLNNREIVPQLVGYQLTFFTSDEWAPQDCYGRTSFDYDVLDNRFGIVYTPYDEGIEEEERLETPFQHLFNTVYVPSDGVLTPDANGYYEGNGFDNTSDKAPNVITPKAKVGFSAVSSPAYIGDKDGASIFLLYAEDHKVIAGEPIELTGFGSYDGFYTALPYGDAHNIAIASTDYGEVDVSSAYIILTDASGWLARDPLELESFLTRYEDLTFDALGNEASCMSSSSGVSSSSEDAGSSSSGVSSSSNGTSSSSGTPSSSSSGAASNGLANYIYQVYTDSVTTSEGWLGYLDVRLFKDAVTEGLREFGGSSTYFADQWIDISTQSSVIKDYFGIQQGVIPRSVIKRESLEIDSSIVSDNGGYSQLHVQENGSFEHSIIAGDFIELTYAGTDYNGQYEVREVDETTITIDQEYDAGHAMLSSARYTLLSPYTLAGDLFNGVSLMLDTAFKALANQDAIRQENLEDITSWVTTGFFDLEQRLLESIYTLKEDIRVGFNVARKKISEDVLLTVSSLISIEDLPNTDGTLANPLLELAPVTMTPDLSSVELEVATGAIHRLVFDKGPRGVASPTQMNSAITSSLWSVDIVGPFANLEQARVKITTQNIDTDTYDAIIDDEYLRVVNSPAIRNVETDSYRVKSITTDSLATDEMSEDEKIALHSNQIPRIVVDEDNKYIQFLSSYRPMAQVYSIPEYDISLSFNDALPVPAIYGDSNTVASIRFEAELSGIHRLNNTSLDFNNKVKYRIFGEIGGRYTDLTDLLSPYMGYWSQADRDVLNEAGSSSSGDSSLYAAGSEYSRYEYRVENSVLVGDIAIDPANIPVSFFDNTPEMYNNLYKNVDIVLYYEGEIEEEPTTSSSSYETSSSSAPVSSSSTLSSSSSSVAEASTVKIPIVTIPVYIYRSQKKASIDLAYNGSIGFDALLSDTTIDPVYSLVLADNGDNIIGVGEFTLVDLLDNNRRLVSIGQYSDMLAADVGTPGIFNHGTQEYAALRYTDGDVILSSSNQQKIVSDYLNNKLRVGQLFNIDINGRDEPWILFNGFVADDVNGVSNIFAHIAPAIGNMYRGLREHNHPTAPYTQADGLYNHINRFDNPHNNGVEQGNKLTYE